MCVSSGLVDNLFGGDYPPGAGEASQSGSLNTTISGRGVYVERESSRHMLCISSGNYQGQSQRS